MPTKFLKRKTSRKYKSKKNIEKDFDLLKFQEQMDKEMSRFKNKITSHFSQPIITDYEKKYKQYITEGFTMTTLMLINRIFIDSRTLPRDLRNNYPLHSLLIKIIRQFMFNELELVYFSIFLDTFGWKNKNFEIMDHFIISCLSIKKYLNPNTDYLEDYLSIEYPGILEKYNKWISNEKNYNVLFNITPRIINEKFNSLKRPFNTYCKNNFIDYNESVDRILHMSLPYGEVIKQVTSDKMFHPLEEFETKSKNGLLFIAKNYNEDGIKKRPISFKVEKNPIISPMVISKNSFPNINLSQRNCSLNYPKTISSNHIIFNQPTTSNLNLVLGQHSSLSNVNVNYNQILNFANSTSLGNYNNNGNNNNSVSGSELIKQQSEINFSDNIILGRTTSGFEQSLIPRNSQPFLDGQDDLLRECFFNKTIDLQHNMSLSSFVGDYKGADSNWVNLSKMMSTTNIVGNTLKPIGLQTGIKEGDLKAELPQITNDYGIYSTITNQNQNSGLNNFGNNFSLGQLNITNNRNKKNLLEVFKQMEKGIN